MAANAHDEGHGRTCGGHGAQRAKRIGRRLLLSILVFLVVAELCSRWYWTTKGLSFWRCQWQIHHTFYPELKRIEEIAIHPHDGFFDVLVLGGSVVQDQYGSIGRLLATTLEAETRQKVRVHNLAFEAHTSLDSYYKYRHLHDKQFDLVMVYHGINEVRANNCPSSIFRDDYSHYAWYDLIHVAEMAPIWEWLIFSRTLQLAWRRGIQRLAWRQYVGIHWPNPSWVEHARVIRTAGPFRQNLEKVLDLAATKGETVVLMTFSYYLPDEYPDVPSWWMPVEIWGKPKYVANGIHVHNTVIENLGRQSPAVVFVDQHRSIPKGMTHFRDICHFTSAGCERFVNNVVNSYRQFVRGAASPTGKRR